MTRTSNARLAGAVLLVYIATGVTSLILSGRIVAGADGTAAKLASMAQHAPLVRVNILLTLLQAAYAMVLGVTLFALTRDEDRDLAVMGLCCRVAEGIVAAIAPIRALGLLSLATTAAVAPAPEAAAAQAVGAVLLKMGGWTGLIAATCFALGSALFSYLLLRARSIPVPLAWLGVVASILLVVVLPLQLAGFVQGPMTNYAWIPMLAFEVPLGVWLLVKGVAADERVNRPDLRAC